MEPRPVEIAGSRDADTADEELLEPPHPRRRWQLIAIATGLVVLAGLVVRVLASAPDDPPRRAAPVTPSADRPPTPTPTLTLRIGAPPDVFPADPADVHLFPVGCNQPDRECMLDYGVPAPFLHAVHARFGRLVTERATTTRFADPVRGRLVGFEYRGRAGVRTVSISVRPASRNPPNYSGVQRSGRLRDVYAETTRGGYRIQVDVLCPPGRTVGEPLVWRLSLDPRLRP